MTRIGWPSACAGARARGVIIVDPNKRRKLALSRRRRARVRKLEVSTWALLRWIVTGASDDSHWLAGRRRARVRGLEATSSMHYYGGS